MALSFTASFFIGWTVGVCTISFVITIIVLTLRGSARGASVFALLRINHKSGGAENSTKQTATTTNVPAPQHDPLPLFVPNPIRWQRRELHKRLHTIVGPKGIRENVGFELYIQSLALKLVYGGQNPAIEPNIMPTIERSMFDDRELVRLAGNPPEGLTEDFVSVWRETLLMLLMPLYKLIYIPATAFPIDGSDPRQKKIDSMASEIADALNMEALDACRRPGDVIKTRLGNELGRAANSALIFFGQPSEWEADWTSDPCRLVAPSIQFMWNGQVKLTRPGAVYPGTPWDPIEVEKFEE
ncbi:hypothetical protein FACUT_3702 [Fusarium acutatum]|uniref:Uncharacterized protein n=1 Tax=Fusarium acutatum TaxID=78861 RepID=A0A8H4JZ10_9HYPO|nr:hypothetical protein FACUT_3702 [Fusarium acutatum]